MITEVYIGLRVYFIWNNKKIVTGEIISIDDNNMLIVSDSNRNIYRLKQSEISGVL